MGTITRTLLIAIIIILVFMFFPKYSGEGTICFGCEEKECSCFGLEKDWNILGEYSNMCIGVPYNCQTVITEEEMLE